MARTLHCYAEGRDGTWEAICLDLDIAVQGRSFTDVYEGLHEAIVLYLESVESAPRAERARLLSRRAPLSVRLRFLGLALRSFFTGRMDGGEHAEFTVAAA